MGRRWRVAATLGGAFVLALLAPATGGHAQAAPDQPPDGGKLFRNQCASCHSTAPGETRIGPSLHGIVGRKAGALPDYPYSEALRQKGAGGLAWTAEAIDQWLTDSNAFVPGSMMNFHQADPQKRGAIITYLSDLK